MKKIGHLLAIIGIFMSPLKAQTLVRGTVVDADSVELLAIKVSVEDTDPPYDVMTNIEGQFELTLPDRRTILIIRADGYRPVRLDTRFRNDLEALYIVLKPQKKP